MLPILERAANPRYAKCVEVSKRIRWDIERDVIRGRDIDITKKFMPDALSLAARFEMLNSIEKRVLSQVQGRTYANMFGLVERFIGAKMLELSRDHGLGDQSALEALVRFTEEELKHQEPFRRIERMTDKWMPEGYRFVPRPNDVAAFVLGKSTWSVLALSCLIEIMTQVHYLGSIEPDEKLSALWKDVFLFHWKEESQHATLDELEWIREDAKLDPGGRDQALDDLVALIGGIDAMLQIQAKADAEYFRRLCLRRFTPGEAEAIHAGILQAYRWQYIVSGAQDRRFRGDLMHKISPAQAERLNAALAPLAAAHAPR